MNPAFNLMFYAILLQLPFTLLAWTSDENSNMFCCQLRFFFMFFFLCVLIFIVAVVFFQVIPPPPPPPPTHTHMHTHHDNELCSQKLLLSVQLKNILQAVDHSSSDIWRLLLFLWCNVWCVCVAVNVQLSLEETYADIVPVRYDSNSPSAFV